MYRSGSIWGGDIFYKLLEVLKQKRMPVNADNITTEGNIANWSYLSKVCIPCIQGKVDLLIGSNAPRMLEPWEVINSHGNGPYAVRTALGWTINGPLHAKDSTVTADLPSALVNRISTVKLEKLLCEQYNHDFNESTPEKKGLSREDIQFLEITENSATLEDGHYSLKLPFKKENVSLPSNRSVAKQRLESLCVYITQRRGH